MLALYYDENCLYCRDVRGAADRMGVALELRNARTDPAHAEALRNATGRATVPVLRIVEESEERWVPESRLIIRLLRERAGVPDAVPRWLDEAMARANLVAFPMVLLGLFVADPVGDVLVYSGVFVMVVGFIWPRWRAR
jgi:glutathione S-transferase